MTIDASKGQTPILQLRMQLFVIWDAKVSEKGSHVGGRMETGVNKGDGLLSTHLGSVQGVIQDST